MSSSSLTKKKYVTLTSMEGKGFKVEEKVVAAMQSQPINNCLTTKTQDSPSSRVILLPMTKAETLLVLIDYSTKRANKELIDQDLMGRLGGALFLDVFTAAKDLGMNGLLLVLYILAQEALSLEATYEEVKRLLDTWYLKLRGYSNNVSNKKKKTPRGWKTKPTKMFHIPLCVFL